MPKQSQPEQRASLFANIRQATEALNKRLDQYEEAVRDQARAALLRKKLGK